MHRTAPNTVEPHETTFEQSATAVLERLQHALASLLAAAPGEVRKAADVERVFGLDHRLGWQVYRIANAKHPLAAGTHVPARVSMERLIRVAGRKGVASSVVEEVQAAFEDFERLVEQEAGSRTAFDTLITCAVPEHLAEAELAARESLFLAARTVRGASMRLSLFTSIAYPSANQSDMIDTCNLMGNFGVQRIRPGALIETSALFRDPRGSQVRTIDGKPIVESTDIMLPAFCSAPAPRLSVRRGDQSARYVLEGANVGLKGAVDTVFADFLAAGRTRFGTAARPYIGVAHATDTPAALQIIDLLVHESLVPQQVPEARVYDMVPHGQLTKLPDPDRELDRVAFEPRVRTLGRLPTGLRCLHLPRYQEMVAHVCAARGWDVERLRGYRVEVEYPVYSWQTAVTLRLPTEHS